MKTLYIFVVFASAIGSLGTYAIDTYLGVGPVFAAAAVGAVGSFYTGKDKELDCLIPGAIYCGSFAGMSSSLIVHDYGLIAISGVIAGVLLVLLRNTLKGIGGKLGVVSFISVVLTIFSVGLFV